MANGLGWVVRGREVRFCSLLAVFEFAFLSLNEGE